ncbi:hypothetical protein H7X87_00330 [Acetobacteraceae bacterium]|nr:hypothetical protein [Candidatus Parcubacteria bacterium]
MDELEISGKRYISTRRAAKDHKYSSDYIGQLIRAKKITGQKVGRSWYVEEKSLSNYFKGEKSLGEHVAEAQVVHAIEEIQEVPEVQEVIEEEVVETKTIEVRKIKPALAHITIGTADIENEIQEVPIKVPQKNISHARYIPINMKKRKGLTYISDDESSFPVLEKKKRVIVPKKNVVSEENSIEEPETAVVRAQEEDIVFVPSHKKFSLTKLLVAAGVGIFIFAAVAFASVSVGTLIQVQEGKATNSQFTL